MHARMPTRQERLDLPFGSPGTAVDAPSVAALRRDVAGLWDAYQASRFGYVTARLPGLLARALAASERHDGDQGSEARALLGLSYQLAAVQLTKLGEAELAWIAADRGLNAVRGTGDQVVTGSLYRSVTHALLSAGRYGEAVRLTEDAAAYLESGLSMPTPEFLSVYGTLFMADGFDP